MSGTMILLYGAGGEPGRGEIPMIQISNLFLSDYPKAFCLARGVENKYCHERLNYAIKLANRYPKIFEWIFIIVCAFGVLFIEDRNTSFVILCLVVAITSNKLSTDSR